MGGYRWKRDGGKIHVGGSYTRTRIMRREKLYTEKSYKKGGVTHERQLYIRGITHRRELHTGGVTHWGEIHMDGRYTRGGGYTRAGVTHGREITGESYPGGVTH